MDEIIASYTMGDALGDGALVEVFKGRWDTLSGGKPIVATAGVMADLSLAAIREIWNAYVVWRREVEPGLPEEDRMFTTEMNERRVWVIEDGQAFTVLYPEEY